MNAVRTIDGKTVWEVYEEFDTEGPAAVLRILADDVAWTEPGGGKSPAGLFVGPEAVAGGVFALVGENFDDYHARPAEVTEDDGHLVVHGRFSGRNKNGAELDCAFEHVFEMRDGKIARFENRPDPVRWAAGWGG